MSRTVPAPHTRLGVLAAAVAALALAGCSTTPAPTPEPAAPSAAPSAAAGGGIVACVFHTFPAGGTTATIEVTGSEADAAGLPRTYGPTDGKLAMTSGESRCSVSLVADAVARVELSTGEAFTVTTSVVNGGVRVDDGAWILPEEGGSAEVTVGERTILVSRNEDNMIGRPSLLLYIQDVAPSAAASAAPAASDSAALPPEPAAPTVVAGSPAASGAVAREAGAFSRGTATCILNASSDRLTIRIQNADTDQAEYTNTNGTEAFASGTWRCMKGDAGTANGAPIATITIASGESFTVRSYNPPFGGCAPWVAVNGDSRCIETIGGTTAFKIGKHPITGKRIEDTGSFSDGGWIQFQVRITD